jgi:nucleoside-diphosphate-sugar epimerase
MKILLAGASGVIGRTLVPLLVGAGHEVAGTTRAAASAALIESLGARPVVVDVYARERLFEVMRTERPDAIIHQLTDLRARDFAANARLRSAGTRNLIDAAHAVGVGRVVAQSLAFAYAPGDGPAGEEEPLDVDAPPPLNQTAAGVRALEAAVGEVAEGVVLRYGALYGPGSWMAHDGPVAEQVRRGELAANEGITSFVQVEDAARAALLALGWPRGAYNIVDDEPAPATTWLPIYAGALGAPAPASTSGSRRGERGASNAKAREQLGWQPRYASWRVGFREALG